MRRTSKNASHDSLLPFGVESLEDRRMLAGDVSAFVSGGGDLVVSGDGEGNEIAIVDFGFGEFELRGLNGTTIEGQSSLDLNGVNDDLRINLKSGDNRIVLGSIGESNVDDITISTRSGNDIVLVESADIDRLRISTSGGNDVVVVSDAVAGQLNVSTGSGTDVLVFQGNTVNGRTRFNTGGDDDVVLTQFSTYADNMATSMGGGDDVFIVDADLYEEDFRASGGGGADEYIIAPSMMLGSEAVVGFEGGQQIGGGFGALFALDAAIQNTGMDTAFAEANDLYNEL